MIFSIFIQILIDYSVGKQWRDPHQKPPSAASGLGLLYLSHKKDVRFIWVNFLFLVFNPNSRADKLRFIIK